MRIVIMTSGSRGDVQPYIALGLGLQRAGYQVCILTHRIFASLIHQYGLEFAELGGDPRARVESEQGQQLLEARGNALRFVRRLAAENEKNQAAGLRAGVPNIVVPFFADQPFWAERVHRLGVATKPIPHWRLTAKKLASAINIAISHQAMRARASTLGARIQSEDGVGNAVKVIRQRIPLTLER